MCATMSWSNCANLMIGELVWALVHGSEGRIDVFSSHSLFSLGIRADLKLTCVCHSVMVGLCYTVSVLRAENSGQGCVKLWSQVDDKVSED